METSKGCFFLQEVITKQKAMISSSKQKVEQMTTTIADQPISLCVKKETIKSLKHQVSALQDQAKDLTEKLAKKELNDSSTPVGINIEGGFKGDVSSE